MNERLVTQVLLIAMTVVLLLAVLVMCMLIMSQPVRIWPYPNARMVS